MLNDSCYVDDADCQINFLRAFCEKYNEQVCKTSIFERALKKVNGCLPGIWKCTGFQEMFGGPQGLNECFPWDLSCTLKDFYGEKTSALTDEYPYMSGMPKSTLTSEELARTDYIIFLKYDLSLWQRGLNGQNIIGL